MNRRIYQDREQAIGIERQRNHVRCRVPNDKIANRQFVQNSKSNGKM